MYDILQDAYSYDARNKEIWDNNWKESDGFFYDNPEIAEKYGLITCIDGDTMPKNIIIDKCHEPESL